MKQLSTGELATLGVYRDYCAQLFGPNSPATKFIDKLIVASPSGRDEEVNVDETTMVRMIVTQARNV